MRLRGIKGELYEGSIRVRTIVSWPGKLSPSRIEAPVHITDWMPTLCRLVGYQPSFASILRWDGLLNKDSQPATPRSLLT
ncbi:MAG: sulfatase-like hydrolase/transferase [Pirellulaceae bacterium]|nr:sulfatase-like hydrolase/transferase [Pirellulaceae bacterium]